MGATQGGERYAVRPRDVSGWESGRHPVAADLDGDGDLDLALSHPRERTVSVLVNDGGATSAEPSSFPVVDFTETLEGADLDRVGDVDLVSYSNTLEVEVLLNGGTGRFRTVPVPPESDVDRFRHHGRGGALGDLDGDGAPEVIRGSLFDRTPRPSTSSPSARTRASRRSRMATGTECRTPASAGCSTGATPRPTEGATRPTRSSS